MEKQVGLSSRLLKGRPRLEPGDDVRRQIVIVQLEPGVPGQWKRDLGWLVQHREAGEAGRPLTICGGSPLILALKLEIVHAAVP